MREVKLEVLASVARKLMSQASAARVLRALERADRAEQPIAIIGMAGRWPGADGIDAFWRVCSTGTVHARPFPAARRRALAPWVGRDEGSAASLQIGAFLERIDDFEPELFGLSARDAELMDPVQRQFLMVSWQALEDAGHPGPRLAGRPVGVYVGYCAGSDDLSYWQLIQQHQPDSASLAFTGNLPAIIAGRVSHLFDLRGPSLVVDTACSSSLVAVHQACQALRQGDCELALAGGVKLLLYPRQALDAIGVESADGLTRPFAGGRGGTGIGEGVAAVVLKPLGRALADGDAIYALVAGSACNQDGRTSGLTVPNVAAQEDAIAAAWRAAGLRGEAIGYVEAHGTGTSLGDPIEYLALARALEADGGGAAQRCALGSAKSLFGHLDSAAGITGLVKAALSVERGLLPPSAHFTRPNERIDYLSSGLYVNDRLSPWPEGRPRHAGVSAFSMNGTNCHVVVGEAPAAAAPAASAAPGAAPEVLLLSAPNPESLRWQARALADHLEAARPSWPGVLRAAALRHHFDHRLAVIAADGPAAARVLRALADTGVAGPDGFVSTSTHTQPACTDSAAELARSYVERRPHPWHTLYAGRRAARLPAFRFARTTFWFGDPASARPAAAAAAAPEAGASEPVEAVAGRIWREALGRGVDEDDDFFAAGGDSLKAQVVTSRLSRALRRSVGVAQLWQTPSLRALVDALRALPSGSVEEIPAAEARPAYPLSPAQQQIYLQSSLHRGLLYNVPFGLRLDGALDAERLAAAVEKVSRDDRGLAVRFVRRDGRLVQEPHDEAPFSFSRATVAEGAGLERAVQQFLQPFDLDRGPLARFALLELTPASHLLLMDFHHLVMDGVSVGVFVDRLVRAYRDGHTPRPARTALDHVVWQERRLAGEAMAAHGRYWEAQLDASPGPITRFGGGPVAPEQAARGERHTVELGEAESAAVRELARQHGHGLFATLAGTYALALHGCFGQAEFTIGTPLSGRTTAGMEDLLGMFVNMCPLPVRLHDARRATDEMQGLRGWLAASLANQEYPLAACRPRAQGGFNVVFALQNMAIHPVELGTQLRARPLPFYELPWSVAKFDLSLFAMELGARVVLSFEWRASALERPQVEELAASMRRVLAHLAQKPDAAVEACRDLAAPPAPPVPVPAARRALKFEF